MLRNFYATILLGMDEGKQEREEVSLEEKRKALFRQQAEQMLVEGKENGLRPPEPIEQWIEKYVGAMEGLHKLCRELNKDLTSVPVMVGHFGSNGLDIGLRWSRQKSPTENIGSASMGGGSTS